MAYSDCSTIGASISTSNLIGRAAALPVNGVLIAQTVIVVVCAPIVGLGAIQAVATSAHAIGRGIGAFLSFHFSPSDATTVTPHLLGWFTAPGIHRISLAPATMVDAPSGPLAWIKTVATTALPVIGRARVLAHYRTSLSTTVLTLD